MINNKIYIIAEIGVNHNGSLSLAKELIRECKKSGADAVKFQKRDINLVYSKEALSQKRDSPWGKTQKDQKEGLEFGQKEYQEINDYCNKKKITWFASAWDLNSLNFLKQFDLKYNKIASAMIVDENFLTEVAKEKNVQQFIFASSEWIYEGFSEEDIKTENSVVDMANVTSEYAIAKLVSEANLRQQ